MPPRACLAIVLVLPLAARGQSPPPPRFEVASVKASTDPVISTRFTRSGGRVHWTTDLWYLIEYAYGMQGWRVSGTIPGSDYAYTVDAVTDPKATDSQVRLMFRTLLRERFRMTAHRTAREVQGYGLAVANGGLGLEEAKEGSAIPPLPAGFRKGADPAAMEGIVTATVPRAGVIRIVGRRVTIGQFCERLQAALQGPIFDLTGLAGKYYFDFEFAQDDGPAPGSAPSLSGAIKDLGLKLEKHKGPVEMLVVDHIEATPTEN